MSRSILMPLVLSLLALANVRADDLLYRYECDTVPYDPAAGWIIANVCESGCSESVENGRFVLTWETGEGDFANYDKTISLEPEPPPPTLWVEWRFRSNHPWDRMSHSCDATFSIRYKNISESASIYGDTIISFEGGDLVTGLDISQFHTYRFESLDGVNYWVTVDGNWAIVSDDNTPFAERPRLQLGGQGICFNQGFPVVNEWDFVRYGTMSYGEQIIATDPPAGLVDLGAYPNLDRFTVTFDAPN